MTNLKTKLISLALAACMLCAAAISVSAAEINQSGGSGSTPVNLTTTNGGLNDDGTGGGTVTPTKLNVTVPTALPLAMSDDGTVVTADNCKIVNNSYGAVRVKTVTISAASDFTLKVHKHRICICKNFQSNLFNMCRFSPIFVKLL